MKELDELKLLDRLPSKEEKRLIVKLIYQGLSKKEIAEEVKNGKTTKWTPELIAFEKLIDKKWIELHSKLGIRELKQLDKKIKSGKIDFSEVN